MGANRKKTSTRRYLSHSNLCEIVLSPSSSWYLVLEKQSLNLCFIFSPVFRIIPNTFCVLIIVIFIVLTTLIQFRVCVCVWYMLLPNAVVAYYKQFCLLTCLHRSLRSWVYYCYFYYYILVLVVLVFLLLLLYWL